MSSFSSGGHLLMHGCHTPRLPVVSCCIDERDNLPATANCAALTYPIILLELPYTSIHKILVGKEVPISADEAWSVQVSPFCLVQAKGDPISNPENTLVMAHTCEQQHVPVAIRWARIRCPLTVKGPDYYVRWVNPSGG